MKRMVSGVVKSDMTKTVLLRKLDGDGVSLQFMYSVY